MKQIGKFVYCHYDFTGIIINYTMQGLHYFLQQQTFGYFVSLVHVLIGS